jgi:hypothetical protein
VDRRPRVPPVETSLTYQELCAVMRAPGCPLCSYGEAAAARYLDHLLYEQVNDPGVRAALRRSGGFCDRHTHQVARRGDALAMAIIAADLLRTWLGPQPGPSRGGVCPACRLEAEAEGRAAAVLLAGFTSEALRAAWLSCDGICRRHWDTLARRRDLPEALVREQRAKLERLVDQLEVLAASYDYRRAREPLAPEVASSWRRALALLCGRPLRP